MKKNYLERILKARVYDVAVETPLEPARALSRRLGNELLIKREDLRNRLVSLAGEASLAVTTKAFSEAGQRISRYLLMQFIINASMGLAVWLGLFLIDVPYSALWGLAAGVFRYIPYVGPWLAALLPITVSVITAPGWEQVVFVVDWGGRMRAREMGETAMGWSDISGSSGIGRSSFTSTAPAGAASRPTPAA